jgi:GNAT superfamily N-acetyltransferase
MKFNEFRPIEMTEEDWERYFQSRERIQCEMNPNDPPPSRNQRRNYMLNPHPDYELSWWQVRSNSEEVVGMGGVWWAREKTTIYDEAKDVAYADMILEKKYTTEKIQREFLRCLARKADDVGKSKLIVETRAEHQSSLLINLGASIVSERATNRLHLCDVNMEMIEQWRVEGRERAPEVIIERFCSVPDADLNQYSELYTETWNQAPLEEAAPDLVVTPESRREMESYFDSQSEIWTTMVSREPDGTISGLTEIWYQPESWHLIEQGLTGVREKYRGRGIGKWLKAEMLVYAMKAYPKAQAIEAGNANANAPMLSINQRMGFKTYRRMWIVSFDIADLLTRI